MKRSYALLFISCMYLPAALAQHTSRPVTLAAVPTGLSLGTNFLSLSEVDAGPSLDVEYRFNSNISVSLDATLILWDASRSFEKDRGYRFRPELRLFLPEGRPRVCHWFTSLEIGYKRAALYEEYAVTKQGLDNDFYQQLEFFRRAKENWEGAIKMGARYYFGKQQHLVLEWSVGMGIKYRSFHYLDAVPGGSINVLDLGGDGDFRENDNYYQAQTHLLLTVPVTLKVAYRF